MHNRTKLDEMSEAGLGVRVCPPCDGLCNEGRLCPATAARHRVFRDTEPDGWDAARVAEEAKSGGRLIGWLLAVLFAICIVGAIGSCVVSVLQSQPAKVTT